MHLFFMKQTEDRNEAVELHLLEGNKEKNEGGDITAEAEKIRKKTIQNS